MQILWYGFYTRCLKFCTFPFTHLFFPHTFCHSQIGSGIGRMILKEEMKARSGSYDNDPWGSARNSRSGSKETLNATSYGSPAYNNTINGCKDPRCAETSACNSFLWLVNFFFPAYTVTWPGFYFALVFADSKRALSVQMTEGGVCCCQGSPLRWKDVETVEQLQLYLWRACSGSRCGPSLSYSCYCWAFSAEQCGHLWRQMCWNGTWS